MQIPQGDGSWLCLLGDTVLYQDFFVCTTLPLCSREYQNHEKCNPVSLTHSCKEGRFQLLLGIIEKITHADLIHDFRVEFADKT